MVELSETQEVYAYFWVEGFTDPIEVTDHLGVQPSRVFERRDGSQVWQLQTVSSQDRLDTHIAQLIFDLQDIKSQILDMPSHLSRGINGVGYFYGSNPGFGLSKEQLSFLSEIAVDLDFDLYNYRKEDYDVGA